VNLYRANGVDATALGAWRSAQSQIATPPAIIGTHSH
jgi:hypothetical protein